jgi:glucose-6-phosphate 1-epimerase
MNLDTLNQQFALGRHLRFDAGQGGLPSAVIDHPAATGRLYLHGSHLAAWKPAGHREVLFMSGQSWFEHDKPIRGGVPICFPWFGPHPSQSDQPAHGHARLKPWTVTRTQLVAEGVEIDMRLDLDPFRVTHRVTLGPTLTLALHVENTSPTPERFEAALHTYLAVADARQIEIRGLDDTPYLDKMDNAARKRQQGHIRFTQETDRVYLNTTATCELIDPGFHRTIRIEKTDSLATVIWNPWTEKAARMPDFGNDEWPHMACIETANVADHAITLDPGTGHEMTATLSVT